MKSIRPPIAFLGFALALSLHAAANGTAVAKPAPLVAPESVGLASARLAIITAELQKHVDDGQISGAVALIGRKGQIAYCSALGFQDLEIRQPMARDSIFRIASMTKVATALAALGMAEEDKFQLDDPVAKYVPALSNVSVRQAAVPSANAAEPPVAIPPARPIIIRDLLRHTSGISYSQKPGTPVDRWFREEGAWSTAEGTQRLVAAISRTPLESPPGTRFQYSFSIDVLGYLLEQVAGKPLDFILQERVFTQLGMSSTGFHVPADRLSRLTSYYRNQAGRLTKGEAAAESPFRERPKSFSGGGGWPDGYPGVVSTVDDWWNLCETIRLRGQFGKVRLLQPAMIEQMVSNQLKDIGDGFMKNGSGQGYGLGVGVIVDEKLDPGHGSKGQVFWAGGPYNTYFFIDGEKEMVGILFVQTGPFRLLGLMNRFGELAHQALLPTP